MEENEIKRDETVNEEPAATENVAAAAEAKPAEAQQIPNEEIVKFINNWFQNIRNTIKVVKEKDANLYKMNSELQAYRSDYSKQLFKSMAQIIVNYREDCAKSLRDVEEYELKKEAVLKYIGYIPADYETLLENIGVEIDGDRVTLNGTEITSAPSEVKVFPVQEQTAVAEEPLAPVDGVYTQQAVIEFFEKRTAEIKAILKDNAVLDTVVGEYIKQSKLIERNEQQIVLYPVIRELVNFYKEIEKDAEEATADPDADLSVLTVAYKDLLGRVVNETENVLNLCGITVHTLAEGEPYDPKRHRIMKFIPLTAEEADKNGTVVKVYSDLYKSDDKVFCPAKVDVYKVR